MSQTYKIRGTIHLEVGNWTREQVKELGPDALGADAVFYASVLREAGAVSTRFASRDGNTDAPMTALEKFKVWAALASTLAEDEELSPVLRQVAWSSIDAIREVIVK